MDRDSSDLRQLWRIQHLIDAGFFAIPTDSLYKHELAVFGVGIDEVSPQGRKLEESVGRTTGVLLEHSRPQSAVDPCQWYAMKESIPFAVVTESRTHER